MVVSVWRGHGLPSVGPGALVVGSVFVELLGIVVLGGPALWQAIGGWFPGCRLASFSGGLWLVGARRVPFGLGVSLDGVLAQSESMVTGRRQNRVRQTRF